MGHAGAIIRAFGESAAEKVEIMKEAGLTVAPSPADLGTPPRALGGPLQAGRGREMTSRPVVVVTRRLPDAVHEALAGAFDARLNPNDRPLTADGLRQALTSADALLTTVTDKVTAEVLAAEPRRAKLVANFGVGFNNIDVEAAKAAGIAVSNTPDVLTEPPRTSP